MTPEEADVLLRKFLNESNRIEGIHEPVPDSIVEYAAEFLQRPIVLVSDMVEAATVFQPDARLRNRKGLDVRVGNHMPPKGGQHIVEALNELLCDADDDDPWETHMKYETLHPFTDGNGRTGRLLWLWQMEQNGDRLTELGFLHAFYYQTLRHQ